ncbi:MAG: hypothetical protein WCE81_05530 [Halobacteriota archaeon]
MKKCSEAQILLSYFKFDYIIHVSQALVVAFISKGHANLNTTHPLLTPSFMHHF